MRSQAPPQVEITEYEVRCPRCRVSFPVGTRKCVHCGGRVGGGKLRPLDRGLRPRTLEDLPEEEAPGRSGVLSPITFLWILLAVAGATYRACQG